jgi:uncharacterized protein (DUF1501 family)
MTTRRDFLKAAASVPFASLLPAGRDCLWLPRGDDRVLLVLELQGGNDGLNTVVPLHDDAYAHARPRLSSVRQGALTLDAGFGLHGDLAGLHALCKKELAAVVHGVGYAEPDRSHFRSRDIWHTADPSHQRVAAGTTGWLGRAADLLAAAGASMPAASVGSLQVPLLLRARTAAVPTLERAEDFQLGVVTAGGAADERRAALVELLAPNQPGLSAEAAAVAAIATQAASMAEQLRAQLQRYEPKADYAGSQLGADLQLVARMAIAGFGTRLFHVGFGGFDTHARQLPTHAGLLRQLGQALAAFAADLEGHGALARTTVLVHSEFGRRLAENASQGTDHGAAAPVFVIGGGVKPGPHGKPPDLGDLVDGDVKATTDFRAVYADLLGWLRIDHQAVLGGDFAPLGLYG